MATVEELQKEAEALKKVFDKYDIPSNSDGSYTVDGKRLSAKEFGAVKKTAKSNYDRVNKQYKQLQEKRTSETNLTKSNVSELNAELQRLQTENTRRAANIAAQIGEGKFGGSQTVIDNNNKRIKEIEKTLISLGSTPPQGSQLPEGTVTPPASAADFRKVEGFAPGKTDAQKKKDEKRKQSDVTTNKVGDSRVVNGVTEKWDGTKWVPEKKVAAAVVDWKPKFREMFPSQSWLLDLDSTKYSGLFKLLETGVKDQMWLTPESQARFAGQLQGTDFYVELKTNDTVRNITSLVGDLGFDTVPFNNFLKDAMNFGWKDDTLKQKVYEEAFRKDPATGNYVNATTIERVRKSSPYLTVANIGKAFFNTVSDSTIAGVLTGSMVQDDVVRQQRELAKGKYGHLSSLIDQGLSLEDISDSYKTQASKLLEKDANSIDMSQGAYSQAFDFGEEGKKRLMSTSEWEVKLRSDANFGWDKTQNAKDEARALASSISQAFGRVI
jgi:hypothetical protein